MNPRVGGEEKSGNIFTKFGEDFGESPNLVTNPVLIMSYILVKIFSPDMVKMRGNH